MSYRLFSDLILQEKKDDGVTQPAPPPDFTSQDAPPPEQQQPIEDPNAGGEPPPDDGGQMGGEEMPPEEGQEGDPNAEGGGEEMPPEEGGEMEAPAPDPNPEEELEQTEGEVFAEIKPEQMAIKIGELKEQYKKLNSVITASLDKINKVSRTTYDSNLIEFIVRKLMELKDLSKDSLLKSFNTRTYIENQVELQRMIMAFNLITNIISDIKDSREKRQSYINKENQKNQNRAKSGLFKVNGTKGFNIFSRPEL